MRETLRILSMKTSAYGLSFFFTQAIFAFFTSIFISLTFLLIGFFQGKGFFAFIAFWIAVLVYGLSTIFMSMGLSTLFRDSKIASQIGSLVLIVPLAVYQLLLSNAEYGNNRSLYNYDYLYIGYPLPFVPMSVIITDAIALPLGDQSLLLAWLALLVSLPVYYFIYVYLDQVLPNTYGISKGCCFCLRRNKRADSYEEMRNTFKNSGVQNLDESRSHNNATEEREQPLIEQFNGNVR